MSKELVERWQKILDALTGVDIDQLVSSLSGLVEDVKSKSGLDSYKDKDRALKELELICRLDKDSLVGIYKTAPKFVRSIIDRLEGQVGMSYRDVEMYAGRYIRVPHHTLSEMVSPISIYSHPKSNPVMLTLSKAKYKPIIQAEGILKKIKEVVTDGFIRATKEAVLLQSDEISMNDLEVDLRQAGLLLDKKPNPVREGRVRLQILIKGAGRGSFEKPQPAADIKRIVKAVIIKRNLETVYSLKDLSIWRGDRQAPQPTVTIPIIAAGLQGRGTGESVNIPEVATSVPQSLPKVKNQLTEEVFEALKAQGKQKAAFLVVRKNAQDKIEILSGHNDMSVAKRTLAKGGKFEGLGAVVLGRGVDNQGSVIYKKV